VSTKRRAALWAFGVGELGLAIPLLGAERRMRRTGGGGIVPFELAGSERAQGIMDTWGAEGRAAAHRSLVLDFPYLVSYSGVHAIWCAMASETLKRNGRERAAKLGGLALRSQLLAGACDAAENAALLGVLAGHTYALAGVARSFAIAKFGLLGVGFAYMALGLSTHLRQS
jgi:hypothetical protein